ncbi:unnamed protein product, partial [Prorocentrum cordatum]
RQRRSWRRRVVGTVGAQGNAACGEERGRATAWRAAQSSRQGAGDCKGARWAASVPTRGRPRWQRCLREGAVASDGGQLLSMTPCRVTLPGGRKFQQQVTCDSKSEQTAARLCRLIYHMWEKGASEDAVKVYRTQICAAWNAHRKLALVKDETPEKEFKGSKSCDKRAKQHKKDNDKSCDKRDKQQGEGLALDIGDAKESSAAWTRVWWHQSRCHWFFRWSTDKVTITFQVTERAAQGDRELAARICRRCFEKIEAGGTKEEADALKKDLLERCCARPAAGPRSPSRPAAAPASGAAAPAAASGATPGAKEGPGEEKGEDSETDQESESSRSGGGSSGSSSSGSDSDADAASGSESDDSCLFEKESGAQAPVAAGSGTAADSGSLPANWEAVGRRKPPVLLLLQRLHRGVAVGDAENVRAPPLAHASLAVSVASSPPVPPLSLSLLSLPLRTLERCTDVAGRGVC